MEKYIRLGVNIDHVATLRQARGEAYPDPVVAAQIAQTAGADGITLHLREDRRHIQDDDLYRLQQAVSIPINLEMAVTDEMVAIAVKSQPDYVCLVPEKREELTTEGGLDVVRYQANIAAAVKLLSAAGCTVSLFIDPDEAQIAAAAAVQAPVIELHTGTYAESMDQHELMRLQRAAVYAAELGLVVNAGHGLTIDNVAAVAALPHMNELNIGHSIISRSVFIGLKAAIQEMRVAIESAVITV